MSKLTDQDIDVICREYSAGIGVRVLCDGYGVTKQTVYNVLSKRGVSLRGHVESASVAADHKKMLVMWRKGHSAPAIAAKLSKCEKTVYSYIGRARQELGEAVVPRRYASERGINTAVYLRQADVDLARKIGRGKLSRGVQTALQHWRDTQSPFKK